ncbi:MAG: ATPase, partial [Clostridiales bacterium]|nr:ATPase [Clostridiales bacterium]
MSSLQDTKKLLKRYAMARIPFIALNTLENGRALEVLREVAEELSLPKYAHASSKGTYDLRSGSTVSDDRSTYGAIEYISDQMRRRQNLTIILTEPPDLSVENGDSRQFLSFVTLASESGGVVIVLSNNTIWNQVQRTGMIVDLDLPNEEEMYAFIKDFIDDNRSRIPIEWDNTDIREATSYLTGVTQVEAENVIAALIANKIIKKSDLDELRYSKDKLFANISGLERIDVDESVKNVGGLEGIKRWLVEKKELLDPEKRDALKAKGLPAPRGILL